MVVDDSASMRRFLSLVIDQDPRLRVVSQAATAQEARTRIKETRPDVLTLDLEMPQMNGLDFLTHLMRLHPMPVVILSSLVAEKNDVVAAAKRIGAYACIPKPDRPESTALTALCDTLANAVDGRQRPRGGARARLADHVVLAGASTGGVTAIETVLGQFSQTSPPLVIAQHMPQRFLESFAERLNRMFPLDVQLARSDEVLHPGGVYIAPAAGRQTSVFWRDTGWQIAFHDRDPADAFCPLVNTLFHSAVPWANHVGAMLLTGLGNDGADGMLALRQAGARTVGQSQDSCVVYGMPGAARQLDAVEHEVDVRVAGTTLLRMMEQTT